MIYLVACKLTPNRDYTAFFAALKGAPTQTWWHYIEDVWLIKTDETLDVLSARIDPLINQGTDLTLVMEVNATKHKGWLPAEAHEWINVHGKPPETLVEALTNMGK